jgi:hypothetical protein
LSIGPASTAPFMASWAAIHGQMCEARRGTLLPRHGDELAARRACHMKPFTPAPLAETVRNALASAEKRQRECHAAPPAWKAGAMLTL